MWVIWSLRLIVFACISVLLSHGVMANDAINCESGDATERLVSCTRFIEASKTSSKDLAHAYDNRGMGYVMLGKLDKGLADFDKAIELNPGLETAYLNRAYVHIFNENTTGAAADLKQAMKAKSNWAPPYVARAIVHFMSGSSQKAIADLTKAISIDPNHAEAYLNRGSLYREQGRLAEAIADFKMTVRLDPFNQAARQQLKELFVKPDIEHRLPGGRVGQLKQSKTLTIGRGRNSVQCTILRQPDQQQRYACLFAMVSN